MNTDDAVGGQTRRTDGRRVGEVRKRGGYLAPDSVFELPEMPAGPAQGAQGNTAVPTGSVNATDQAPED